MGHFFLWLPYLRLGCSFCSFRHPGHIPFSKQESRSISVENRVLRIGGAHRAPLFVDVSKQVLRSISFDECVRA